MNPNPNPRELILKLLVGAPKGSISARGAVAAGEIFGIRENSVRVALVRLAASGAIEASGRGAYRAGPRIADLAADVRGWRSAERRLREWSGAWLAVHAGGLLRSQRSAWRRCDRALRLLGFREIDRDLFIRPDNLSGGVASARDRLYKLGLAAEARVLLARDFDDAYEARARSLWNGARLTESYAKTRHRLERWLETMPELELESAARESFLIGNEAIRQFVFDPLLPDPLVDSRARRAFLDALLRFDRVGHSIWREVISPAPVHEAVGATLNAH